MRRNSRVRRWGTLLLLCLLLPLAAACANPGGQGEVAATSEGQAATTVTTEPATSEPQTAATSESPTAAPSEPTDAPTATEGETATEAATATEVATATEETAVSETETASAPAEITVTAPLTSTETVESDVRPQFGVVAHLYYTDRERVLQLAQNAGFEWVRQQVPWKDTEKADRTFGFDELDRIVESVNARGQKLMLSVTKSPDFLTGRQGDNGLPLDPKDFGRFTEELASRYKGRIHAIEVWNEQNLAVENGGRVTPDDVGRYVEILKDAYPRIKAVDPEIVVVAGALSSTGVTEPDKAVDDILYLTRMYEYNNGEIKNYLDAQGFHPASAANPPEKKFPEDPGDAPGWNDHPTHFFRHIEDVRQVMVDSGLADKDIWITEMGWATENNTPGYEYGNYVSLEDQADYLERALARIVFQYSDWVGAVFIWNLNFAVLWGENGEPLHEQAAFGILNPDWSPRPSFSRVQGFINASKSNEEQ